MRLLRTIVVLVHVIVSFHPGRSEIRTSGKACDKAGHSRICQRVSVLCPRLHAVIREYRYLVLDVVTGRTWPLHHHIHDGQEAIPLFVAYFLLVVFPQAPTGISVMFEGQAYDDGTSGRAGLLQGPPYERSDLVRVQRVQGGTRRGAEERGSRDGIGRRGEMSSPCRAG